MTDDHFSFPHLPFSSGQIPVAPGTFPRLNSHSQERKLFFPDAMSQQRLFFQIGLHENPMGRLNQGKQRGSRVCFVRRVVGVIRIAEMQKRREQKWHVEPAC